MAFRTDVQRYNLGINTDCFRDLDKIDQSKVTRRRQGERTTQPRSNYGRVLWDIAWLAHLEDISDVPDEPDPPDPPETQPWDSGYPPRAYNMGSNGQNCIFNVHINCTLRSDGKYVDQHGLTYSDSGLCDGGRTETPAIAGLKQSDMKDQAEPWDAYEWFGRTIGPNKENYPAESYNR